MKKTTAALLLFTLAACNHPNQNRYGFQDVGKVSVVEYGTIKKARHIQITGQNTGIGATTAGMGGLVAGSYMGSGSGSLGAALAGAIIAGVAGAAIEQQAQNREGMEYVIKLDNKQTIVVVQNLTDEDEPLAPKQRVMVQTSGSYQRVLPAE